MRRILFFCLFITTFIVAKPQAYDKNCFYGISFDISKNPNWGFGELVITDVEPSSPAEIAGIKVGDIIMEINGKATYLRDNQTIANLLFGNHEPITRFTIRNMNTYFKEYELKRKCINYNSVSERQLSEIFAYYSPENTHINTFTLPLKVSPTRDVDFADYHTYNIYTGGTDLPVVDRQITQLLEKELEAKGLVKDTDDPDIVIQTYYSRIPNPSFTGLVDNPSYQPETWRYDITQKKMVPLPLFDAEKSDRENRGQYIIEFGFTFYEMKYINKGNLTQIWDCSIKDYLSSRYSLEEYVKFHAPLMLMQFPFSTDKNKSKYSVDFNKYNYTGMYFDRESLTKITDVDDGSPAYKAGIREGYLIKKIDQKEFDHDRKSLMAGYERFVDETKIYREDNTGMLWNMGYKKNIIRAFDQKSYMPHFSYLYKFNDYINEKTDNTIAIEAWDGRQLRRFVIIPEIRQSVIIKALQ